MPTRRLPILCVALLSALAAGPLAAVAASAAETISRADTGCAAALPTSLPEEGPPAVAIGELDLALPGGADPLGSWSSCRDFCVTAVQACLAACPGEGEPQHYACRNACYDDYATCVNGCWEDEVPESP